MINVLKAYEKIDANAEIRSDANFSDLGLDSLDAQDVILAMEDEFAIEIPDEAADKISGVKSAVSYLVQCSCVSRCWLGVLTFVANCPCLRRLPTLTSSEVISVSNDAKGCGHVHLWPSNIFSFCVNIYSSFLSS